MAAINEAWHVLGDPGRRAVYDASLRRAARPGQGWVPPPGTFTHGARPDDDRPARFPIWMVISVVVVGVIFVFTAGALRSEHQPPAPDGLLRPGECANIDDSVSAIEVPCHEAHQYVVRAVLDDNGSCPYDTKQYRERQRNVVVCLVSA